MPSYQYLKFTDRRQDIRLITLLPGEFEENIRCTISHASLVVPDNYPAQKRSLNVLQQTTSLDWIARETIEGNFIFEKKGSNSEETSWKHPDKSLEHVDDSKGKQVEFQPKYEALSYTWGTTDNSEAVYIESSGSLQSSDPGPTTLQVGPSLASALRHLRLRNDTRVLWIDAICINQKDIAERNEQVRRMGIIYTLAHRVVVWLGPEAKNSSIALSTLQFLGEQVEFTRDSHIIRSPQSSKVDWFHSWVTLPYDDTTWRAIQDLVERSWFERLWVWQEVQLANRFAVMQCGQQVISWSRFRRSILCLFNKKDLPSQLRGRLKSLAYLAYHQVGQSLSILITQSRERKCMDPRDRVYGVLGLASSTFAQKISPQYSLTVGEVYKQAFLAYLDHFKSLELLSHSSLDARNINAASWVPDWSVLNIGSTMIQFAAGISCAQAKYIGKDALEVIGVPWGTVDIISEPVPDDINKMFDVVRTWQPKNLHKSAYVTGESTLDAFLTTLYLGTLRERMPLGNLYLTLQEWKKIFLTRFSASSRPPNAVDLKDSSIISLFDKVRQRIFLQLDNGYFGLGPAWAQPGDKLAILLGCNTPMLLRPLNQKTFQVVGKCYVQGLSDCASLLGPLPKGWKVQLYNDSQGQFSQVYMNCDTGATTREDPRLDTMPEDWERVAAERTPDDPFVFAKFKNRRTGEVRNSDPRLLPEALKMRGVNLESFALV